MASKYLRRETWWIKFRHPLTGKVIRESLETSDPARAELLRERIDLHVALLEPRFSAVDLPARVGHELRVSCAGREDSPAAAAIPTPVPPAVPAHPHPAPRNRTKIDDAVASYLRFIRTDNAAPHVANKVSMLRRFLGSERMAMIEGTGPEPAAPSEIDRRKRSVVPFFTGTFVDEITAAKLQEFIEELPVVRKTKRHYRELFHHFFEVMLKFDLYHPTSLHRPNPVAALPSYVTRNRRIVFLSDEQVREQLDALRDEPAIQAAVAVMIFAGLRRTEALWLTKDAIAPDRSFLSVVNRFDEQTDIESSLKTGDRSVTIIPKLAELLAQYLPTVTSKWLLPKPDGDRWSPDGFSDKLARLNKARNIKWTCLHYRHTFATQRASEGWPLFWLAKEMGNSVAVVEEYYAGYLRPSKLNGPAA